MSPAIGGIKWCFDLSVCLFHLAPRQGLIGVRHLGQATRAVQTVHLSVYGRRSAAIGRGRIVSPRDNLLECIAYTGYFLHM